MSNTVNVELRKELLKFCDATIIFKKLPEVELLEYAKMIENDKIKSIIEDEELKNTIEAFFRNNLNISATSKDAFMHRNTLIYRIEKIRKVIGLNIKNFEDARILKNIITINSLLSKIQKTVK